MARPRRGDGLDLNALLQQAAELKEAQLRATRRAYEAAPECLRHTLVRGRQVHLLELAGRCLAAHSPSLFLCFALRLHPGRPMAVTPPFLRCAPGPLTPD